MANSKNTPNLPGSSRMQMPSTSGGSSIGTVKQTGTMSAGKGTAKRVTSMAKGKGMTGKNPYC